MDTQYLPEISILISTKKRREDLFNLLHSLKLLNYPEKKIEIIVVEETNSPLNIKGIKYIAIPEENKGFGYTRNIAVNNASKEIIVFVDDDCMPEKNWLAELVKPFKDDRIVGIAGSVKVKDCNTIGYCENILGFPGGGLKYIHKCNGRIESTKEISTLNAAYRKKAILEAGGFEEYGSQSGSEDYLLAKLICRQNNCVYVPSAIVYHKVRGTFWKNLKWFVRRGKSDISILNKLENPQNRLLWILRSSFLGKFFFITGTIYLLTSSLLTSFLTFSMLYGIKNFCAYSFSYKYLKNLKALFLTPVLKFVMDLGTDIGRIGFLISKDGRRYKLDSR